jgi:YgiT-type zinc finger domain-containing protein
LQPKCEAILHQKCSVRETFQICPKAGRGNETEPVRVVVATDPAARIRHVITGYRSDLEHFEQISRPGGSGHERECRALSPCGGEKQPGTTTFTVDLTFGVVVVREVPAFVCAQCGDAWIDDPVAAKLESIVAEARRKQALVQVTQ